MKYGLDFPPFGGLADPREAVAVAVAAEAAGWDGVFLWDHIQYRAPVTDAADPWMALAGIAQATERVHVGPMVTPLPRRRPSVVARQATALDQLSDGRLVLGVGLGLDSSGRELSAFGEELDDRTRAEMLDEGLTVLDALWSGAQVDHAGRHYRAADVRFLPTPVQRPRPPVWVAGRWPYQRPLRRAARWDGLFLIAHESPDQLEEAASFIAAQRAAGLDGFDLVVNTPYGTDPRPWEEAGATWWLTEMPYDVDVGRVWETARAGPPR